MNKKGYFFAVALLVAILLILLNANIGHNQSIKIGVITALSGEFGSVGEEIVRGIRLAQEKYEDDSGKKIDLIIEDDQFDPKKGLSAYKKLTELDKVDGLLLASSQTLSTIFDQLQKSNIPTVSLSSQSQEEQLDNIFNASYFSFDSVNGLGKYVSEMDLPKKIYVHMNDPMINKVVNRFKIGYGSGLLLEEILPNDENYIRSTAIKIIAEDPDLIILSAWPNVGAQFVRHVLTQSKRQMLFAFDPLLDEGFSEYKKIVGDMTKLDGSIVPIQKKYDSAIFADLYKKRYGIAPSTGSDVAYDGFNVLVETYDKDWSDWVSNLRKYNKPGVTGEIKFDDVGLRLTDYKITNVVDGKIPLYSE